MVTSTGNSLDRPLVAQFGWADLFETRWGRLVEAGIPSQLADLSADLGARTGRPVRAFAMPTIHTGLAGLALPFVDDDGILFDPSMLDHPGRLSEVVAHELAHMLYPGWRCLRPHKHAEMEAFALIVGPALLSRLPTRVDEVQPMVDLVVDYVQS